MYLLCAGQHDVLNDFTRIITRNNMVSITTIKYDLQYIKTQKI